MKTHCSQQPPAAPWVLTPRQHDEGYWGSASLIPEIPVVGRSRFIEALPVGMMQAHHHPEACELHVVLRGELGFTAREQTHLIQAGSAFFTAAGQSHGHLDETLQPGEWYRIQFQFPEMTATNASRRGEMAVIAKELTAMEVCSFPASQDLLLCLDRIISEHRERRPFGAQLVRGLLLGLMVYVLRDAGSESSHASTSASAHRIMRARRWIDEHIGDNFSIKEVGEFVGLSPSRFRTQFLEETGFSPVQYVAHRRIGLAKKMLREGVRSCTEIGLELGFCSSAHFASVFRRQTGLGPQAFRKQPVPVNVQVSQIATGGL